MTAKELLELKVGDRVFWLEEETRYAGTVTEAGYLGVKIEYDDGTISTVMSNDPPERIGLLGRL